MLEEDVSLNEPLWPVRNVRTVELEVVVVAAVVADA